MKLAFIAPSIAERIAEGRAPIGVNLQMLMDGRVALAPCWTEQQRMFNGHWFSLDSAANARLAGGGNPRDPSFLAIRLW